MGPKPSQPQTGELFGYPLRDHLNLKHPLILLGDRIQWERIDALVADQFKSRTGRPATSPRLIAGLLYLQHAFDLSPIVHNSCPIDSNLQPKGETGQGTWPDTERHSRTER